MNIIKKRLVKANIASELNSIKDKVIEELFSTVDEFKAKCEAKMNTEDFRKKVFDTAIADGRYAAMDMIDEMTDDNGYSSALYHDYFVKKMSDEIIGYTVDKIGGEYSKQFSEDSFTSDLKYCMTAVTFQNMIQYYIFYESAKELIFYLDEKRKDNVEIDTKDITYIMKELNNRYVEYTPEEVKEYFETKIGHLCAKMKNLYMHHQTKD